jgi:hypothetical protein
MKSWIDLAAYRLQAGKAEECVQALMQALRVGGEEAKYQLRQDPRFTPIRTTPLFQQLTASQESRFPL